MNLFITILILIAAVFMILIVLVQNSKGGGLAAGFSSSNQIMGVRKTTDFLEKATWGLAIAMMVLSIIIAAFPKQEAVSDEAAIKVEQTTTPMPGAANPGFDAKAPVKAPQQAPAK
ncbi:MAG: preprotein translocase subunit SecG [Bacteroidales bacterium]